jgi:hypothetical protein
MTHEFDIFPDDLPEGRGQPRPLTDLIDVEYWDTRPSAVLLARIRQGWIEKGWSAVTSEVIRQTVGYPYRVEYRGVK